MRAAQIEARINPPAFIGPETVVLSPPLGSVQDYVDYITANREHYRRLFGAE